MPRFLSTLLLTVLLALATSATAQDLVGSYFAFIGRDDLYNSKGQRLTEPWQILRQDRANYHRFGIWQVGDEGDNFFGSIDNRAIMERMVMNGKIDSFAGQRIVAGGVKVHVQIYGYGNRGDFVQVTVSD